MAYGEAEKADVMAQENLLPIGVAAGWIDGQWLAILAIALSLTFLAAAPANSAAHRIYARVADRLRRFETAQRLPEDEVGRRAAGQDVLGPAVVGAVGLDADVCQLVHPRVVDVRRRRPTLVRQVAAPVGPQPLAVCGAAKLASQALEVAPHVAPREVVFVDSLPMTATGKIQRFKLREPA